MKMISLAPSRCNSVWCSCAVAFAIVVCASVSQAALVHKYTFNDGTADDSVGTAHGTSIANNGGTVTITGGTATLSGGGPGDSYIDLPDGIASAASSGGNAGEISVETWVTANSEGDWRALWTFGNSGPDPEDNNGGDGDYWQMIPRAGVAGNPLRSTTHLGDPGGETPTDDSVNGTMAVGVLQHVVGVLNVANDTNELYVNGVLVGTGPIHPGFDPNTFENPTTMVGDTQNWLGRSQWGDGGFDGSYEEFKIYDHALSANEVANSFAAGPMPIPEPTTALLALLGLGSLGFRRIRRR